MIAFSPNSTIGKLLLLRTLAIVAQLIALLVSVFWLKAEISLLPALVVIAIASVFQLASVYAYRNHTEANPPGMWMQLAADVVFLTLLLAYTGGATNAFVSLLLLPIVIAAITLSFKSACLIALSAMASYSWLLWKMPAQGHQHDMTTHFQAMWINFVFSAIVIVWVVSSMADKIKEKERRLAQSREQQLYQEQLVALGASAAQVAHQLASPVANLHLLHEELTEEHPDDLVLKEMEKPLEQCRQLLNDFRTQSQYLQKHDKATPIHTHQLVRQLKELLQLEYPSVQIEHTDDGMPTEVLNDPMLLPALQNIANNAARASTLNHIDRITLCSLRQEQHWHLSIADFGRGFKPEQLSQIGLKPQTSAEGFGVGLLLTQITVNRLGGQFLAENYEHGAKVTVTLPVRHI
ncbi:ATP-binding protein (plasmid) [Pseudoalteromonas xiamenensis]|uniref:ATP-binding protein n=1 Tax=Pseudoalteromonas xiamenensis TaxID=882626 RepID=UPI0027E3E7BD|nr:ATP-binding protein [Pseudoalteromonas xiamenensis]WMN62233.1 ATP-binding protein [Pseudoalteromonas xiamenensis]